MLTVWLDGWQMQCCGEPFGVGSRVSWTLNPDPDRAFQAGVLGPELAATVTHSAERHGGLPEDTPVTRAWVESVRAVLRRAGEPAVVREQRSADREDDEPDGLALVCYLVELRER